MCWAALIPVAIGAVSGLMQGSAAERQANQQAAALRQNALYLNQAANDARTRGEYEADWQRIGTQSLIGTQRAAQAASGGVVGSGSYGLMTQDTAQLGELDALTISNNAAREAYGYQVEASNMLTNAKQMVSNAKRNTMTSILGGAMQGFGSGGGFSAFSSGGSAAAGAGAGTRAAMAGGTSRLNYNQAYA